MSTKKNLIVPKLQKQNLGKVNPQKAEYLYISKEFCKEGLSQIIKDGGVQFKEIQKFVKDHQEPQYILVHASKLEEGYLAISLLAGIYNEIHSRGEWKKGQSLTSSGQTAGNASPLFHLKKPMTITTGRKMTSPLLETPFWPARRQMTPLFLTGQKMRINLSVSLWRISVFSGVTRSLIP